MSLYLVESGGRPIWLVFEDTELARIYAYVPNTGLFHHHRPLGADFYWDRELTYTPIDATRAHEIIAAGVLGKLDGRSHADLIAAFQADPEPRGVAEVLGAQPIAHQPSRTKQARAKAAQIAASSPGQWFTWRLYPRDSRQRAYVAAHDLRAGKVKALGNAGVRVDVRVTPTQDGRLAVQVTTAARQDRATG